MATTHEKWLDDKNLKKTKHRLLILRILEESDAFLSAEDIFMRAKEEDTEISLSTVYRILETLSEKNIVSAGSVEFSKKVLYELAHQKHGHRLICLSCHKVIYVEDCPLGSYENKVSRHYGFDIRKHKLDFYGYCKECQQAMMNQEV
ncbi:MAG: Fur family transcriptional regulator [Bacillota bacterium]